MTNHVKGIEGDVVFYDDEEMVRVQVVQFYQKLYWEMETKHPTMDRLEFAYIEEEERQLLKKDFDKDEVIQELREMEGDKVFGSDGATMAFFQKCQRVVEGDFTTFFRASICTLFLKSP